MSAHQHRTRYAAVAAAAAALVAAVEALPESALAQLPAVLREFEDVFSPLHDWLLGIEAQSPSQQEKGT